MPKHSPWFPRRCIQGLSLGLMLLCLCWQSSYAQDTRTQREREALRRQQALLQQARGELDTLRAENAAVLKQKDDALAAEQSALTRLGNAQRQIDALRAELSRLRTEQADALRAQNDLRAEQAAADSKRLQAVQRERSELQMANDELQRTNQRLVLLLEQRTTEVADLRKRNAALHALAYEAVELFVRKGTLDTALQDDPLFGLSRVRTESAAEELRIRIDAQRGAPR
jgi:chromosome segregation ATPase